jgi:hypothetical protein
MRVTLTKGAFTKTALHGLVLGLGTVLYGCSDSLSPVEPAAAPPSLAVTGPSAQASTPVAVLKRNVGLATSLSVARTIGPEGGSLAISRAGIKVTFPKGAVASPVKITVTAQPGRNVAFTFGPHGLKFKKPVTVQVSLLGTQAENNASVRSAMEAGYVADGPSASSDYAVAAELLPVQFNATKSQSAFSVWHFSGYLLTSGRKK